MRPITLIIVLLIIIASAHILNKMLEVPQPIKMISNAVLALCVLALCVLALALSLTGLLGPIGDIWVGQ